MPPTRTQPWFIPNIETGCWEWTGTKSPDGYGVFSMGKASRTAHRLYYEMLRGPIPRGYVVHHVCENPCCVNPDHLEAVTQADNVRRGRKTKLTPEDVARIHEMVEGGAKQRDVACEFGVSQPCISLIVRGVNWNPNAAPHLGTKPSGRGSRDRMARKVV